MHLYKILVHISPLSGVFQLDPNDELSERMTDFFGSKLGITFEERPIKFMGDSVNKIESYSSNFTINCHPIDQNDLKQELSTVVEQFNFKLHSIEVLASQ